MVSTAHEWVAQIEEEIGMDEAKMPTRETRVLAGLPVRVRSEDMTGGWQDVYEAHPQGWLAWVDWRDRVWRVRGA